MSLSYSTGRSAFLRESSPAAAGGSTENKFDSCACV